jgi:SAM-dependent methyltransferase
MRDTRSVSGWDATSSRLTRTLKVSQGTMDGWDRYLLEQRYGALASILEGLCERSVHDVSYLELGSGAGEGLAILGRVPLRLGAIVGVDIDHALLKRRGEGKRSGGLVCSDAGRLPFRDGLFDVVSQVMVLSSILSHSSRVRIASEMERVVRPGGHIISIDLRYPRVPPMGRTTMTLRRLRKTFSGSHITTYTFGLLPPLARWFVPRSRAFCDHLGRRLPLQPYRLVLMRRPHAPGLASQPTHELVRRTE